MTAAAKPAISVVSFHLIRDELLSRGYSAELLKLSKHYTKFVSPTGAIWITQNSTVAYPFIDYAVQKISANKQTSYRYAASHQVSIPQTLATTPNQAEPSDPSAYQTFLERYKPLVVKPLDSFGSRGLTMDVSTAPALTAAISKARDFATTVLLQRQVSGQEVRLTVIKGRVVSVLLRQTPQVVGDGHSTTQQLISQENVARRQIQTPHLAYPELDDSLIAEHFLTDKTILERGRVLELSRSTMVKGGASLFNISEAIHDTYKQTACLLARQLSPSFLVVDMIIEDYLEPQTDTNYAFIEFNTSPALKMYYGTRDGKAYDIVPVLADML